MSALSEIATRFAQEPFGRTEYGTELPREYGASLERLAGRPSISVIVPVYNAPSSLQRCLGALSACSPEVEVIIVDDCSPDPEIEPICTAYLAETEKAKLVVNDRNLGFAGSVNAGLRVRRRENDVVVLNSDTAPTPGWLRKLSTTAYLRRDVACVNPLSNAAGIFSLPTARKENELPPGWTAEMCARVLEDVAPRSREAVSASSGFCLYIRGEALEEVGLFDDLLFARGYAEDNDFCERATAAGFSNHVDDATFVFHERAASFADWKAGLQRRNARILRAVQPDHRPRTLAWEERSVLDDVQARYSQTIASLESAAEEERLAVLEPVVTRLRIADQDHPETGSWERGERVLSVSLKTDRAEIDVFGAASCELELENGNRAGLIAWLVDRWSVDRLELIGGPVGDEEAVLLRALLPSGGDQAAASVR